MTVNELIVHEIVSEIVFTNDPGYAAKVLALALVRLESGASKSAHEALDYACEQVFDSI